MNTAVTGILETQKANMELGDLVVHAHAMTTLTQTPWETVTGASSVVRH